MLTRSDALIATKKLRKSFLELREFFRKQGVQSFEEDVCRRNMMLSAFQEKHVADQFRKYYPDTINDGKTGNADIYIPSLSREIECKLTSLSKDNALNFQTDYNTLKSKKSLDYIYICSNRDFNEFSFIVFEGLTIDDFSPPAASSKGRAKMKKHIGFSKANLLIGEKIDIRMKNLDILYEKLKKVSPNSKQKRISIENSIKFWENSNPRISILMEKLR
jgi:hypothetical protein